MAEVGVPTIRQTVLDTTDPRGLAEFYRQMFDLTYREGDEPPPPGEPDPLGQDWLVLQDGVGRPALAFQRTDDVAPSTWPEHGVPQMLHLDTTVPDRAALDAAHERALSLGATLRFDRSEDPDEPLRVYADPAGHPFCVFVSGD